MTPEEASRLVNEPKYTHTDAAEKIGISRTTLWRERTAGKIKYYLLGGKPIYSESHIADYIEQHLRQAVPSQGRRPRKAA